MPEEFVINIANRVKQLPPYLFGKLNALKIRKRRNNIDVEVTLGWGTKRSNPATYHSEIMRGRSGPKKPQIYRLC